VNPAEPADDDLGAWLRLIDEADRDPDLFVALESQRDRRELEGFMQRAAEPPRPTRVVARPPVESPPIRVDCDTGRLVEPDGRWGHGFDVLPPDDRS